MLHGFDVSAFQGSTVPRADFVFVKATEGRSYTSSKFAAQWRSAKSRAAHRGAYHFARPEGSSAASQAARFLAVVEPSADESVWLDLEASELDQAQTNAWARAWGDYVRAHAPGVTSGVYMGSGYATNGTGRALNSHFDFWWYPQYPSTARTSTWRAHFTPWLPHGLTCGWSKPHIWQFTDNFGGGMDASVSWLTLDQLAAGGRQEDDMPEYVSLGQSKPQAVTAGHPERVVFDVEHADSGHAHARGPHPGILTGGQGGCQFVIEVDVPAGMAYRLIETDPAKDYATSKTYAMRTGVSTSTGWCDAGRHLYVELHPAADGQAHVAVKAQYWRHS